MSVEEMDRKGRVHEGEDIETLSKLLSVVADFLNQLKGMVKEFIETFASSLDGSKLGREVAGMYKSLVEAGMPPEKAMEFTEKFLNAKLEAAPKMSKLIEQLQAMFSELMSGKKWGAPRVIVERADEEFKVRIEGEEEENRVERRATGQGEHKEERS